MKEDIYHSKRRLKNSLRNLEKSDISDNNKKAILDFRSECSAQGIGLLRVGKYVYMLRRIAEMLGKDFADADINDMKRLVADIEQSNYADWTKHDFKVGIKKFYKWFRGEKNPPETEWIKTTMKNHKRKLPEDLLTEDDVIKLIQAAEHPRDRAFVSIIYESGCRVGELMGLRLKHIQFDKYGAMIIVNGKTGSRRVRLIAAVPYITRWINKHPKKEDPNEYVWLTRDYRNVLLGYGRVKEMLRGLAKKAGIKKKVNPHNFRHSRATYLANHLTEAQLKEMFGWTQGSDMASIYIHLSGRDVDNAILKVYNIDNHEDDGVESKLKPKDCSRCNEINPATNRFCSKCGMVLDNETMIRIVERDMKRKEADEILDELMQDEDFREILFSKIKDTRKKNNILI